MQVVDKSLQILQHLRVPSDKFRKAGTVMLIIAGPAPHQINGSDVGVRKRSNGVTGLPALKLERCLAPVALVAAKDRPERAFLYLISTVLWPLRAALIRSCDVWLLVSGCWLPSGGSKR